MADRTYYRREDDQRLIEEAKYNPNRELAIALGERLADVLAELDERIGDERERVKDFERYANKLDDKVYELRVEIDKLEMMLDQRNIEIEQLKKEQKQ